MYRVQLAFLLCLRIMGIRSHTQGAVVEIFLATSGLQNSPVIRNSPTPTGMQRQDFLIFSPTCSAPSSGGCMEGRWLVLFWGVMSGKLVMSGKMSAVECRDAEYLFFLSLSAEILRLIHMH